MLTLQWILQVLLTNEFVKIDCLIHACMFFNVNTAWTGNGGDVVVFMGGVETVGSFWAVNSC